MSNILRVIKRHPQAALILTAFIILAVVYSIATPPLEAGDESRHYAVIKYMSDTGKLIVQNDPSTATLQHHWSHEGNQPPLYYGLAAVLTGFINTGSWDDVFWYNPHTTIGNPLRTDNKNITIHPPGQTWPWRGSVLAVHLIRLLSIAMATVTIIATYAIALRLFKERRWPAAGAMAIAAFTPMFIFISASVNNDNAVIMFVTLAVWLMITMAENIDTSLQKTGRNAALLGLLIGLGALSKLYALGLIPLAGLLLLWLAYKNDTPRTWNFWRNAIVWNLIMLAVIALVAGWFYFRNTALYQGDFLALQVMRETAGERTEVPTLATLRAEFEGFRIAYWALFGGVNILADNWIYAVLDGVSILAAIGVIGFVLISLTPYATRFTKNISPPAFIILIGWFLIMVAGFIVWNITQPAGQGRLFYPAIASISSLAILGLTWWLPQRAEKIIAIACSAGLFLFATASPFIYIAPAYARPPTLTQADIPADIVPVDYIYDGNMKLIGYQLHTPTLRPAEDLDITLYWEVLHPMDLDYSSYIHLLGRQRQVVGQLDTYPGQGKWPTTLLTPGNILADTYHVTIDPQTEFEHAPTRLLIDVGLYDLNEPGLPSKPATTANSESVTPIVGSAKLIPWQWPDTVSTNTPINFADKITLLNHQIDDAASSLTLIWQVNQPLGADYTVFIQAWQNNEQIIGFDGPPVQDDYPTSLWESGEVVVDVHALNKADLAPGEYTLRVGLYNPATGERLPAFDPDGPLQDYAVNAGTLKVRP